MRVWITRPEAQGRKTQQRLAALGVAGWLQPVMTIEPLAETPTVRQQVMDLDLYQFAIFISQNAVHYGVALIDRFWPQWPVGLTLLAIGQATAKALAEHGHLAAAPVAVMDSEALSALPELQALANSRVIIFKGEGGRALLAETLRARGGRVDECPLYGRRWAAEASLALQASDFGSQPDDAMLAYSGESVELLAKTLASGGRQALTRQPLVVPGSRVAGVARALGFEQIIVADNATDDAMLGALLPNHPIS
ncbi:uroporphyrinogen-III synthase [Halioxenophilus sp. WMMB6]|uniref:uroporphyrinogen-III synthase n=1 Tax=Halioxenophilus sp. WMMB6 TaxID=3073815 RepID=UPI00295EC1C6|nr:uroporphyrinogen-III synthase [Halioxenophilus sp. WMMB6]